MATSSEAIPEGTFCSAHTTPPLPANSNNAPIMKAERQWMRLGAGVPREAMNVYKIVPAITKRTPAIKKGGMVSTAKRMAR
jgi:hypothetical protein